MISHARLTGLLRQWILPSLRPWAGAKEPRRVRADHLTGQQPRVQFLDGSFRCHIKLAQPAQKPRWRLGIDRDWLGAVSHRNIIQVRDKPFVRLARPYPDRVDVETEAVMSGHRRFELIELGLERLVSSGHHSYPFQFFHLGIAARNGCLARPHIRLSFLAQHWKSRALGSRIEDREFHRPRETALVPRVVAP